MVLIVVAAAALIIGVLLGSVLLKPETGDARLRRLERKMNRLLRAARIDDVPELSPEVQELARDPRRRIQAVRRHREQTGLSLADAKADIEDYYRTTVNR